ncbi:hypothetical protein C2G38_2198234 [Gigaspora rosea]|uniref:Uncharacterized protein n=1 Tax=Gigaspora rosea TaxID=44941 RepID=A0A397UU09_9GLOM|nr:hypothetical protein C2G38_2198234 [Gigaspora rosea]
MPNYLQQKLTSKLLNFQNLSISLNSSLIPSTQCSRIYDSASQNLFISNHIDYCDNGDNNCRRS